MKVAESPLLPMGMDQNLRYSLQKWMRDAALKINNDTSDVIIDLASSGLVLKDTNGHYWRVSVDTLGALVTTDLGTSKP